MGTAKIVQAQDVKWEPHPQLANVKVAFLVSHRDEGMDLTCMLVHSPVGTVIEKHTHECDDIIYVVKGKAKLWIEDRITNEGFEPAPLMLLQHCNLGFPLVDAATRLVLPAHTTVPRDDAARFTQRRGSQRI